MKNLSKKRKYAENIIYQNILDKHQISHKGDRLTENKLCLEFLLFKLYLLKTVSC